MLLQPSQTKFDGTIGLRAWSGRARRMARGHRHHDLELNYLVRGEMRYLMGGDVLTLPARQLTVLWGDAAHQMLPSLIPPTLIWVTIPLDRVLSWQLPTSLIDRLVRSGYAVDRSDHDDEPALRQWENDLARGDVRLQDLVCREIDARLRRLAITIEQQDDPASLPARQLASPADRAVARMVDYIAEHHADHDPVRIEDIAAAAYLHPSYAMTLFRQRTRMTLNECLTRHRVAHAQRLLATTSLPVIQIGFDSGFGSTSRFFQAFKEHVACSPNQYRKQMTTHVSA